MPRRVARPCQTPGCPGLVRGSGRYCPEHAAAMPPDTKASEPTTPRPSPSRRGYDRRWQRLRKMHLARYPLCVDCAARGIVTAATDVDHIIPLAADGTHADDNLQSLCHSCHSRKTAMAQRGRSGTNL